jgi:hypothetical protein
MCLSVVDMKCPICNVPMDTRLYSYSYCSHRIGKIVEYKAVYDLNTDGSYTTRIFLLEKIDGMVIGAKGLISMDGLVFIDEKRIEKLLLLI